MSRIVIFCGAPCSGKSTLSEIIARKLDKERICEDKFKVDLYERKGGLKVIGIVSEQTCCYSMK